MEKTIIEEIYRETIEKGCCHRCALRFSNKIEFTERNERLYKFGSKKETILGKRKQSVACYVCLGVLEDDFLYQILSHKNIEELKTTTPETFKLGISYSASIPIRERSMTLYLNEKFPNLFSIKNMLKLKRAWQFSIYSKLEEILKKTFYIESKFLIFVKTEYDLETVELFSVKKLRQYKTSHHKFSRKGVFFNLSYCDERRFRKCVSIPPIAPLSHSTLKDINYDVITCFLQGRYCKLVRNLYQSRNSHEEATLDNSVEGIIVRAFQHVLGDSLVIFKVGSKEQFDVRILGNGRFFSIEVIGLKSDVISDEILEKITAKVDESKSVIIRNLECANRKRIADMLELEKTKCIEYKILCRCKVKDRQSVVDEINKMGKKKIVVAQRTPIRILHTRGSQERMKEIYWIKSDIVQSNEALIQIDLLAENGLHIPEFIHGDLNRTRPNLEHLVHYIAMDITDIKLLENEGDNFEKIID